MLILSLDTKSCMTQLLIKETFHSFAFIDGEITTFNRFSIDGYIHRSFFDEPPVEEYSRWSTLQEYCYSIIRGKRTPLSFKFVFSLPRDAFEIFLEKNELNYNQEEIQGLYLNLRYDGTKLQCITGTSLQSFTMDKSIDTAWDSYVKDFLQTNVIPWEIAE